MAVEFLDTRSDDGLYRKYRRLVAGDATIRVHMIASPHWEVRGHNKVETFQAREEEMRFLDCPDEHDNIFQGLQRALDLDLVAFDYAYDPTGRLVVWEANPYPYIRFGPLTPPLLYRAAPVHRSFAAMVSLYLARAGLTVPQRLQALLAQRPDVALPVSVPRPKVFRG